MFTYAIRNIVHKQANNDINILYYPANDLIDDVITDWDAEFFILAESLNNKINKNNICYTSNIALFEYDFIFCYGINDNIVDLSIKLHIPIIVYLRFGSYDDSKIPDYNNIFYIVEHTGESEQDRLLSIKPTIRKNVTNKENNICLFINNQNNYGNLIEILSSKIKNLSIVDEEKITQEGMIEILSRHKLCIDPYPKSMYKMLFCSEAGLPYVTIPNDITNQYKDIYSGIFFMEQDLGILLDLFNNLINTNIVYDTKLQKENQDRIQLFLKKIKTRGLVL